MPRSCLPLLPLALGLSVVAGPARSQPSPPPALDCAMLARMPNPPMTVQTCEQRMRSQVELMAALETPGGERPGDEQLTCAQIGAELRSMKVAAVSPAHAAEGQAAGDSVMALMQRSMAEGMGLMATQTARTAAAAAIPGNAAGHAAAMANQAEQQALQARTAPPLAAARNRTTAAQNASMDDLARAMRSQPRFARLLKLGIAQDCRE